MVLRRGGGCMSGRRDAFLACVRESWGVDEEMQVYFSSLCIITTGISFSLAFAFVWVRYRRPLSSTQSPRLHLGNPSRPLHRTQTTKQNVPPDSALCSSHRPSQFIFLSHHPAVSRATYTPSKTSPPLPSSHPTANDHPLSSHTHCPACPSSSFNPSQARYRRASQGIRGHDGCGNS